MPRRQTGASHGLLTEACLCSTTLVIVIGCTIVCSVRTVRVHFHIRGKFSRIFMNWILLGGSGGHLRKAKLHAAMVGRPNQFDSSSHPQQQSFPSAARRRKSALRRQHFILMLTGKETYQSDSQGSLVVTNYLKLDTLSPGLSLRPMCLKTQLRSLQPRPAGGFPSPSGILIHFRRIIQGKAHVQQICHTGPTLFDPGIPSIRCRFRSASQNRRL